MEMVRVPHTDERMLEDQPDKSVSQKILYLFLKQDHLLSQMQKPKNTIVKKKIPADKKKIPVRNKSGRAYIYAALIALLTVLVFSNSLKNGFVRNFDDVIYVSNAGNAKALSASDIGTIFSSYVAGMYHPVTMLSLAAEIHFFGPGPYHFHLINLFIHILNVLLVFWFIYLLTKRMEVAVIVALFFGIHPMHVESVSWISERKDVLYTFFFLASLITYLKYISSNFKFKYLVFSLVLFVLSLLSKSAAVCLAPVLVLVDHYLGRKFISRTILEKIPYFLFALAFGIISILSQSASGALNTLSDLHYSFMDRIFLWCYSFLYYIVKAFAPFNLSILHYYPAKLSIAFYLAPLGIAAIVFAIFKFKRIRKDLVFGTLFYLLSIILMLQFIPVGYSLVSERYSYVPFIGIFFIAGKLFSDYNDNKFGKFRRYIKIYLILAIAAVAMFFSVLTYQRNKVWKDGITLFDDVILKNPEAGHAYWARGTARADLDDPAGALSDFNEAIALGYKTSDAYNSRAKCYFEMDSMDAAMEGYTQAITMDDKNALAYYNRGHAKQKLEDYKGSVEDYKKAIENNIENPALVYNEMSFSQFNLNDLENALFSIKKAIELEPSYANEYLVNKARIEYLLKDYDSSLTDFNKVISSKPDNESAYYYRGLLKVEMKDTAAACNDFSKAAELGNSRANEALKNYCSMVK
jgi:protein O-mannosyl-transferase